MFRTYLFCFVSHNKPLFVFHMDKILSFSLSMGVSSGFLFLYIWDNIWLKYYERRWCVVDKMEGGIQNEWVRVGDWFCFFEDDERSTITYLLFFVC